ncbi:MAG TPA: benzoate-CoA ligase family protein [Candidatus Eremiobacteraceae bacterium]|nr:benzoate-CoA ligase family protein [Candidatus Eremiobacteraceae bacterium]
MTQSAHIDTFARDNLPPRSQWPEMRFDLPELQYPERLNCGVELLDVNVRAKHGGRPAIVTPKESLTYAELLERTDRIAHVIVDELGCVPGSRVLLRGPNDATMVAAWLAVMKAGCIAVTTMPLLRVKELTDVVGKARVRAAICQAGLAADLETTKERCSDLERIVYYGDSGPTGNSLEAAMLAKPASFLAVDTAADDVCMIAFTSGTTGVPKGTMHFHRDVLAVCDTFSQHVLRPDASDVFCGTPPLAFTYGLGGALLFPLRAGAAALQLEKTSPELLLDAIARYKATVCFTAPTMYRALTPLVGNADIASLKKCVSAGEALPSATRAAWKDATGIDIIDGIGSTEMLHIFIGASGDEIRAGSTGKAVPGYTACVLDDDGKRAKPGVVGRLAVKGPTGCRYLADERQKTYVVGGWNLTGDAYSMDEDGYFWYQARTDDMIVSAGNNIAGPEVEFALLAHAAVLECAVVGIPDDQRGMIVKAYVVLRESSQASPSMVKELQDHVKATIAPYKYPRAMEFVSALPRTATGKLQRFKLREETASR